MAPLLQDCDLSLCSHDYVLDCKFTIAPLHIPTATITNHQRCVSFAAKVDVHEVLGLMDYTPQEIKSSWFDADEERRMRSNVHCDAMLLERGCLARGPGVSIRGLESRTRDGILRKKQSRMDVYAMVFREIDVQHQCRYMNDDLIAEASLLYSEPCAVAAYMLGRQDELEALAIYSKEFPPQFS